MKTGWQTRSLSDICEIERGGSPRPIDSYLTDDPDGINWIKIGDTKGVAKYIYETQEKIRPEGAKRSRLVVDGDFILSNSMSFGRPYIMKTTGCIHDGWLLLRPKEPRINQDYLFHVLGSDLIFRQFDSLAAGSTVRNLNIGLVKTVRIPVPPPKDQERIVAILDEAFEGFATAKANAEKNLQHSRSLLETHLRTVIARRLERCEKRPLVSLCSLFVDSAHRTPKYQVEGIPALRPRDVVNGRLNLSTAARVSEQEYEIQSKRHEPREGDIVYSRELSYGWAALLPKAPRVCLSQGMCLFRPSSEIDAAFLLYMLNSSSGREQAVHAAAGTAHPHINLGDIKSYSIPRPPLGEQKQIVQTLNTLCEESGRLEAGYQRKLVALDDLKQSLLHQAFTGKL